MERYYHILGLQSHATLVEVKRAYRSLALQYHPDKNKQPGAKEHFIAIHEAYTYIKDNNGRRAQANQAATKAAADSARAEAIYMAKMQARKAARARYREFKKRQDLQMSRNYSRAVTFLVAGICFLFAVHFGQGLFNTWYVDQNPKEAIGWVIRYDQRHFWVQFKSDGENMVGRFIGRRSEHHLLTPNGMPVVVNSQFLIKHRVGDPTRFYVDYKHITPRTLGIYLDYTEDMILSEYPEATPNQATCLAVNVLDHFGIDGMANLVFMRESLLENPFNNAITFANMSKKSSYIKIINGCQISEIEE